MKESLTKKLERVPVKKVIVVIAALLLVYFGVLMVVYLNTHSNCAGDEGVSWEHSDYGSSIEKEDSDTLLIDGKSIPWPDRLPDAEEMAEYGTDPDNPDTDGDGMEDGWEIHYRKWDPDNRTWTLDPLVPDAFGNPDGDGYDSDHDGHIADEEALFNLREYCGGALYDFERGIFDESDPIFGGLSPVENATEIMMLGGFHLFDDPEYREPYLSLNPSQTYVGDVTASYAYTPPRYPIITTNPSDPDTDGDGMDDGWETHFNSEWKDLYYRANGSMRIEDSIILSDIEMKMAGIEDNDHSIEDIRPNITRYPPLDPLLKWDPHIDLDVYPVDHFGSRNETVWIYRPDGLTSMQEYRYGTSPLLWDTDGDSFYDTMEERFHDLSDPVEVHAGYEQ